MNNRRDFLKLGALFVPALVAPRVAYSFLRAPEPVIAKTIRGVAIAGDYLWSFDRGRGVGETVVIQFMKLGNGTWRIVRSFRA